MKCLKIKLRLIRTRKRGNFFFKVSLIFRAGESWFLITKTFQLELDAFLEAVL